MGIYYNDKDVCPFAPRPHNSMEANYAHLIVEGFWTQKSNRLPSKMPTNAKEEEGE
jgi:hypothetical protein